MPKTVRWGLLSTANINRRLIPPIRASKRGELVAVASRDLAKAKDYARKWDIPRAFGSYQEMLDSGEVDAVYISLPNHLHANGLSAPCKPACTSCVKSPSPSRWTRWTACSPPANRAAAFWRSLHVSPPPADKDCREWIRSGRLGRLPRYGRVQFPN